YGSTKRFPPGWVGLMHTLQDHKHRAFPRPRLDLRGERLQRFLPALLRRQFKGGIPPPRLCSSCVASHDQYEFQNGLLITSQPRNTSAAIHSKYSFSFLEDLPRRFIST